ALNAITENGDGLVFEDLLDAIRRVIRALDALLDSVPDANLFHRCPRCSGRPGGAVRVMLRVARIEGSYLDVKISGGSLIIMDPTDAHAPAHARDVIDELLAGWRDARPDLDPSPLAVVGRVIVLAQHLEVSVEAALAKHGLRLGQFDILATLRRHGPKGGLT